MPRSLPATDDCGSNILSDYPIWKVTKSGSSTAVRFLVHQPYYGNQRDGRRMSVDRQLWSGLYVMKMTRSFFTRITIPSVLRRPLHQARPPGRKIFLATTNDWNILQWDGAFLHLIEKFANRDGLLNEYTNDLAIDNRYLYLATRMAFCTIDRIRKKTSPAADDPPSPILKSSGNRYR